MEKPAEAGSDGDDLAGPACFEQALPYQPPQFHSAAPAGETDALACNLGERHSLAYNTPPVPPTSTTFRPLKGTRTTPE